MAETIDSFSHRKKNVLSNAKHFHCSRVYVLRLNFRYPVVLKEVN